MARYQAVGVERILFWPLTDVLHQLERLAGEALPAVQPRVIGPEHVRYRTAVIPEAPFLFSVAALSASLAGLAGLVAALRRGSQMRPADQFRLQQIVEFCFANIVMALTVVPLAIALDSTPQAIQVMATVALAYQVVSVVVLRRRQQRFHLGWSRAWYAGASILNVLLFVIGLTALLTGGTAPFELLLVLFLARPMFVFLLVLQSFEES